MQVVRSATKQWFGFRRLSIFSVCANSSADFEGASWFQSVARPSSGNSARFGFRIHGLHGFDVDSVLIRDPTPDDEGHAMRNHFPNRCESENPSPAKVNRFLASRAIWHDIIERISKLVKIAIGERGRRESSQFRCHVYHEMKLRAIRRSLTVRVVPLGDELPRGLHPIPSRTTLPVATYPLPRGTQKWFPDRP